MEKLDILTTITFICSYFVVTLTQTDQPLCLGRSCYPATGNLLVGREKNLKASSTCGLLRPETYCVVGELSGVKKCFTCDSRRPWTESSRDSHLIENIVSTFSKDRLRRWWQAENGKQEVSIQLDLDAEFHFTHLIITFKTFRPKAMYIERSFDFGKTWLPYRYFAEDCQASFPDIPMGPVKSLKEPVICEEKYSNVLPASGGEVVFKVLPPALTIHDPYSQEVQDLIKLTNLRLIFNKLHTLGDDLIDQRKEINEKYYYSVYDMVVRGSCSCYGHASRCVPSSSEDSGIEFMVHSKCECTHNTKGKNCDQCADFFNDRPWMPARGKDTNECKKCECHEHATSCHFDPAVYHSRGNVSGGVCDNCMHNTDGLNCELCKSHFYQDPARDLRDPLICQPCDCDPVGTQNNGECDMRDDPDNGLIAGRCKCKDNVGGPRCDRCLPGFWDFTEDGCIACSCHLDGTRDNNGCDQLTGDCQCKRYVIGRNCDQCLPGYWGLSKEEEGCQPCGCDVGGSFDNFCDTNTGQCNCRPGISGRACDQAIPGYFVTDLDYLRYEAEFASGSGSTQVVTREVIPGYPITWTGPGFMRAYEKDSIEFTIENVPYSMNYEIIIRYETQMPNGWDDVRVSIRRPGPPDADGKCANRIPQDDYLSATLSRADRFHIVAPEICFEKGKTYYVTLDFEHYRAPITTPGANILIDSIALIPVYTEVPVREDTTIPSSEVQYCNNLEYDVTNKGSIPEHCKKFSFSIGAAIQNQTLVCDCDPTGSESSICDPYGGQCRCKPNVSGRRCEMCTPGSYGFGVTGCQLCNCNAQGSRDNLCEPVTGQCLCQNFIDGRACDTCEKGMYSFPNCISCICNGHTDVCEDRTGVCIGCRDYTTGPRCDQCVTGYYGDPTLGIGIPCKECMCPGGKGSGIHHADECHLDPFTKTMICDCPPQFAGDKCERCAINHYGNPLAVNGTCTSCGKGCNHNIDMLIPGSCDSVSGLCLKCQYNTAGDRCEFCADEYYGNAPEHSCIKCICNGLGSVDNKCNRTTGQCTCWPNVIGESCDSCAPDHWGIALGDGCRPCGCDNEGSLSSQCNEFDGQCDCVDGRGGLKCDQCMALHYGDPKNACFPCDCNPDGSEILQCDAYSGQCKCLPGITGLKCDRCDRGTTGTLPNCVPCGECFDNWDATLKELRVRTEELLAQVNLTKVQGAVGVYDDQFVEMEKKLKEILAIISQSNQSSVDLANLKVSLLELKTILEDSEKHLEELAKKYENVYAEISETDDSVTAVKTQIAKLVEFAQITKKSVEELITTDINGAFNNVKANDERSRNALSRVQQTESLLNEARELQNDTLSSLEEKKADYERKYQINVETLNMLDSNLTGLVSVVLNDINRQVCDSKNVLTSSEPCDPSCGGGGCKTCGQGDSCTNGAQGKASSAKMFAENTQTVVKTKSDKARSELEKLNNVLKTATTALTAASEARNISAKVMETAYNASINMTSVLTKITHFLEEDKATPENIQSISEHILNMSIPMSPESIAELAQQINETIGNLTNIDQILNETSSDLAESEQLKLRADNASKAADDILRQVNDLNKKLSEARRAQNSSEVAINKTREDIMLTRENLKQIGDLMTNAVKRAQELMAFAESLYVKAQTVSRKMTTNSHYLSQAVNQANSVSKLADQAADSAKTIQSRYAGVSEQVRDKYNSTKTAYERTIKLLKRASDLASKLTTKHSSLTVMQKELTDNEQQMNDLQKQIDKLTKQMEEYIKKLTDLENYHNTCEAAETP